MKPDQYCTFYITRHGQTDMNVAQLLQGQTNSRLTEKGKQQAKKLAKNLQHIKFDAIFSSDLIRAQETAIPIAKIQKLIPQISPLLRERTWGKLEGKPTKFLREFDTVRNALSDDEKFKYKSYEDIESDEELVTRMKKFIQKVASNYAGKTVLLISHGNAMLALLINIEFWKYSNDYPDIPHTAYIKFRSDGKTFILEETKGLGKIPL